MLIWKLDRIFKIRRNQQRGTKLNSDLDWPDLTLNDLEMIANESKKLEIYQMYQRDAFFGW